MDLVSLEKNLICYPQGFRNIGANCYMNSLLQGILSCTSIYQVLKENQNLLYIKNHRLAQLILTLFEKMNNNQSIEQESIDFWRIIILMSQKRKDKIQLNTGQQDSHEGLMMVLDILEQIPEIKILFEHRHNIKIRCDKCQDWVVDRSETNYVFEVQSDLKTEQHEKFKNIDEFYNTSMSFNTFLKEQNGYVDDDYICPKCHEKGSKFKKTTLTMVPEILPVVLKKYHGKQLTPFPNNLYFVTRDKKSKFVYVLVSQIEHSGNMFGGHYWAICLRKNNNGINWYNLNDSSISNAQPGPTNNSYLLFYHYSHKEDITEPTPMDLTGVQA